MGTKKTRTARRMTADTHQIRTVEVLEWASSSLKGFGRPVQRTSSPSHSACFNSSFMGGTSLCSSCPDYNKRLVKRVLMRRGRPLKKRKAGRRTRRRSKGECVINYKIKNKILTYICIFAKINYKKARGKPIPLWAVKEVSQWAFNICCKLTDAAGEKWKKENCFLEKKYSIIWAGQS